jgi:lysyl-tRNA synthetase class 2
VTPPDPDAVASADPVPTTEPADSAEPDDQLPEQMRVRREKYDRLSASARPPFPVTVARTASLAQVRAAHPELNPGAETDDEVGVTGRVIFIRNSGKLCFATLREDGVELQVMLSAAEVGVDSLAAWKADVDLGDIVFAHGRVIASKRGELSVLVDDWQVAAKALRPLPVAHKALNEETRVRYRYLDLIVRPEARRMVQDRALITRAIRETLHAGDFVEIETPVLNLVHGGASARPFTTHMNAFDLDMSLRIATELYLKRAVAGGLPRVYELGRVFRNEGVDSTHSPEYTALEAYAAWGDYHTMAELTRELVCNAARAVGAAEFADAAGRPIELFGEWAWTSIWDFVSEAVGEPVTPDTGVTRLQALADRFDVVCKPDWDGGQIVLELFEKLAEDAITQPTYVTDYPASVRPLARPHRDDPRMAEAWDLYIGGVEVGVAYSELVDPVEQRRRLVAQAAAAVAGDPEAMRLDEDFLRAMEHGMPPMGGMGLGIDRVVMLLTNRWSIRETILFPLLKPLGGE